MHTKEEIFARFPELSQEIRDKLMDFARLLKETNARVNLISRKDEDDIAYRHVAFCLAISKFLIPKAGAKIADVGTGGGLPGIVMAIVWPQAKVFMFDGIGRKIEAISAIIKELGLKNAVAKKARIEETKETFDYATGRSVCALPLFFNFVKKSIRRGKAGNLENGVIYFKGGELEEELVKKKHSSRRRNEARRIFRRPKLRGQKIAAF